MKRILAAIAAVVILLVLWHLLVTGKAAHLEIGTGSVIGSPEAVSTEKEDASDGNHDPITILFGGDMAFDRYIRTAMRQHGRGYPLAPLQDTVEAADYALANLEGPITEGASVSETSAFGSRENYIFTFPKETATALADAGFDAVNLGNNHILNFKEEGVKSTEQALSEAGIAWFGSPLAGEDRVLVRDIRGVRVAFVNYNQFVFHGEERAFDDIAEARQKADVVVVYAHWGKEYEPEESGTKELAHRFIDAGADAIIGSHPHVIEGKETYKGKEIYYSLGNLVFDQYFEEDTMHGLLVRMMIDPATKALSYEDVPVMMKRTGETVLAVPAISQ